MRFFNRPVQTKYQPNYSSCWRLCDVVEAGHPPQFLVMPECSPLPEEGPWMRCLVTRSILSFQLDFFLLGGIGRERALKGNRYIVRNLCIAAKEAITRLQAQPPGFEDWHNIGYDNFKMERVLYTSSPLPHLSFFHSGPHWFSTSLP